jgi:hypothetical protein
MVQPAWKAGWNVATFNWRFSRMTQSAFQLGHYIQFMCWSWFQKVTG